MILSIKFKLSYIKAIQLFVCTFVAFSHLRASDIIWKKNINNQYGELRLLDTLVETRGKIFDSVTNEPVPFATISIYKGDSKIITFFSDAKGEFSTDLKYLNTKVKISAIGYEEQSYYFANAENNLVRLAPVNNILPNVTVSSKAPKKPKASINKIIKKVNKHFEQNYGNFSFDQTLKFYSTSHNYDSLKNEMTDLVVINFNKNQKTLTAKKWHQDTLYVETPFQRFIGVPSLVTGDLVPSSDILRKGFAIGETQRESFDYKFLTHYHDKKQGSVYLVSFKPNKTIDDSFLRGRTIGGGLLGWDNWKGEMLIREDDYAVVSLKYIWEANIAHLNKSVESDFHSANWKKRALGNIIANSKIYNYEYSYSKDSLTGKYFVQTIKAVCYETGYQIENHRKVQLYYHFDATSLGIKNIVE